MHSEQIENRKNSRFDLMAMILSFMVVMIHSSYVEFYTVSENIKVFFDDYYTDYISGFAVPMFFMISAIKFYRNYDYSKTLGKLRSRVNSILIPYISWNFISVLWIAFLTYAPVISKLIKEREKFYFSLSNILGGVFWFKYIHPFWYMALLMVFTLLCPLIYTIIKNKYVGICSVVLLYLADALPIDFPKVSWPMLPWRTLIYCSAFYLVGALIGKYAYSTFCLKPSKKTRLPAVFIYILAVLLRAVTGNSDIVFIPAIILGGFAIWAFAGTFEIKDSEVFKTSFFIYPAHTFVLPCVNKLLYLVFPDTSLMCILNCVLGTVLSYAICILLALFVKKYFPKRLSSILNGSRA